MAIVLKQFPWAANGYDVEILNAGDERDFGDALVGLTAEGFVLSEGEVAEPAPEPVVDLVAKEIVSEEESEIEVVPEVKAEPAEPEVTPEPPTIVEPAPEPVRQPRKRK